MFDGLDWNPRRDGTGGGGGPNWEWYSVFLATQAGWLEDEQPLQPDPKEEQSPPAHMPDAKSIGLTHLSEAQAVHTIWY